jgi:hypothetical protein
MHRILLLLLILGSVLTPAMATEEPAYQVLERDGDFELRSYGAYLIAETHVDGSFEDAGNAAFQRLFRYISGANRGERKIAMTAPVVQQNARGTDIAMTAPVRQETDATGGYRVAFIVPAGFTRATVPEPTDPLVTFREVSAQTMAVLRYSGRWTEKLYREQETRLKGILAQRAWVATGATVYARYNAPFVPWPLRRNEVMVPVRRN